MTQKTDRVLMEGYLNGSVDAIAEVDSWIAAVVFNSNFGFRSDTEDIVQDTRCKLIENFQNKRFEFRSSLKTYVMRISKHTCIDYLRKKKYWEEIDIENVKQRTIGTNSNPEKDFEEKERIAIYDIIYKSLPQQCQNLWKMIYDEKLPYKQIAQRLNIAEGTVKSRAARCLDKAIEVRHKITGNPR
jgi:RNA polymerase sigma-70 factor (ECF subfamily)